MRRTIPVIIVCLALVFVVRSDEKLRCYMCTSLTDPGCDIVAKAHDLETVECTLNHMVKMQTIVQQHNDLRNISYIFDVDTTQNYQATAKMACAKMLLKVNGKDVTVRNCQTAKSETLDPCVAIRKKFSNDNSVEFCELCMHDACNNSINVSPESLLNFLFVLGTVLSATFYNAA